MEFISKFRETSPASIIRPEYFDASTRTILTLSSDATMKETALVAFCYDAEIPRGKSLHETVWWVLTDYFAGLNVVSALESLELQMHQLRVQQSPKAQEFQWNHHEFQWNHHESHQEGRIPVVETPAGDRAATDRSPREGGGVNHHNLVQIKGRVAFAGQPKLTAGGSVKY